MTDLNEIERRAQRVADERHRWANESGIVDRDVIEGLRRAKELAVDDVPTLIAEVRTLRAGLDTMTEVARGNKQHVAVLTELVERVEKFADELGIQPSVYGAEYADRLRKLLAAPTEVERCTAGSPAGNVDWAVRVTNKGGKVHDLHADDPFTHRSSAEQYAALARLGKNVAKAEVISREVWHGPWTTALSNEPNPNA